MVDRIPWCDAYEGCYTYGVVIRVRIGGKMCYSVSGPRRRRGNGIHPFFDGFFRPLVVASPTFLMLANLVIHV